jgi:iron-sulfur cluster repair protein YtfE (RIC family)
MKITDALLAEHAVFYAQFAECERALANEDLAQLQVRTAMIACGLATHAAIEDDLLFRTLAARTDVQPTILVVMREEHDTIESGLQEIQNTADLSQARSLLSEVVSNARNHFAKEERVLFPLADELLSSAEQERLAESWASTRGVYLAEAVAR